MQDRDGMNPYLAGALSGLLLTASVVVSGNYFGTSTSIVQLLGMLEKAISPELVARMQYFTVVDPVLSWQILFVAGIFLGSFLAATFSGEFRWRTIPDLWRSTLGDSTAGRMGLAFIGGIIAMMGARLAGGCPSGQLSAMALLSLSSLPAMAMFFIVGIIVARLVYGGGR